MALSVAYETMRSVASTALTGSYQVIGSALAYPSIITKMVNNSDVDVTISTNGVDDMDSAPSGGFWLYDFSKNINECNLSFPKGTQFYIKGTAGTTGTIDLVTIHTGGPS